MRLVKCLQCKFIPCATWYATERNSCLDDIFPINTAHGRACNMQTFLHPGGSAFIHCVQEKRVGGGWRQLLAVWTEPVAFHWRVFDTMSPYVTIAAKVSRRLTRRPQVEAKLPFAFLFSFELKTEPKDCGKIRERKLGQTRRRRRWWLCEIGYVLSGADFSLAKTAKPTGTRRWIVP